MPGYQIRLWNGKKLLKVKRKNKIKESLFGYSRKYCSTKQKDEVETFQGVWKTNRWGEGRTLKSCVCMDIDDTDLEA